MHSFTFFLFKCLRDQIWPCRKIGQGQPRVIIYINFIGLKSLLFFSKFQGNLIYGSGEDNFLRGLPHMSMAAILVMWPGPII